MEYEIKPAGKLNLGIAEIKRHSELLYFFTWRDVKVKYKQTVIGLGWSILQPLAMMLLLTFLFQRTSGIKTVLPYSIFAFSGLMLWNIFASGLTGAGNSMITNSNIIRKIYFPRLILPVSSVLVALFDFLMTIPVLIGLMLFTNDYHIHWYRLFIGFPAGILLAVIGTLGPGCFLAALNVKYRDFKYVLPFLVQILFFVTPIIYPRTFVTNKLAQDLLSVNPMSAPVEIFRWGLGGAVPEMQGLLISIATSVVLFFVGIIYFRKTEYYFADLA